MGYLTGWQEAEEFLNNLRSDSLRAKLKHGIGKCPLGQHLVIMKDGTSYCRHNPDSEPDTGFKLSPKAKLGIATALVGGTALAIGATVLNKKKPAFEPTPSPVTEKVEEVKTPPPQEPNVEKENETPVTENAQEVSSPPPKKPKAKKKTPATNVVDEQVTEPPQPPQQKRGRGRPKKEKPPVDPNKSPAKRGRPPLNNKPSATISPDGSTEKQSKTKVSDRPVEPVTNKEPVKPTPAPSKLLATLVPKLKEIDESISEKEATKVIQSELKAIKPESDKFNKLKIEADKKIRDFGDKPTPTQQFSLQLDLDTMARLQNTERFIPFKDKLIPTGLNLIGKPLPTPTIISPPLIDPPVLSVTTPENPSLVTPPTDTTPDDDKVVASIKIKPLSSSKVISSVLPQMKALNPNIDEKDAIKLIQNELSKTKESIQSYNERSASLLNFQSKLQELESQDVSPEQENIRQSKISEIKSFIELDNSIINLLNTSERTIPFEGKKLPTGLNLLGKSLSSPLNVNNVTPKQPIESKDLLPTIPTAISPDASNKKPMTFNEFINGANSSKMGQIYDGDSLLGDVIISKGTDNYADKLIVKLQGSDRKTFTSAPFNMGYNSSIDDVQSTVSDYFSTDNPSYNIKWREYSPPKTTAPNNKKPSTPTPILVPQKDMVQAGNGTFTGNPEHDSRLALYQQFQSQGQSLTFAQEKSIEIYTRRAKADPSKWQVGQGVAYKVGQQINRGFQISQIDPDTKLALLSQVADTGLTVTGSSDKLPPSWVHIGDLVTDNSYNSSPSPTAIAPDSSIPKETEEIDLGSTDSFELPNGQINKSLYRIKKTGSFDKGYEYALEEKTLRSNDGITFEDAGWIPFSYGESPQQALTSFLSGHTRNFDLVQNNSILVQEAKQNASSIISSKLQAQSDLHRSQQLKSAQKSLLSSTEVLDVFSSIDQSQLDAKQKQNLKARIKETTQKIEEAQSLIASLSSPQNPPSPPVPSASIPDKPTSSPLPVNPAISFPPLDPVKLSEELTTLKSTPDGLFLGSVSTVKDRITEYRVRLSSPNEATKPYILEFRHINNDRPYPWSPLNFNDTPDAAIASYMALNPNHNLGAIAEKTQLHLKAEQSQERMRRELENKKIEEDRQESISLLTSAESEKAEVQGKLEGELTPSKRKILEKKLRLLDEGISGYRTLLGYNLDPASDNDANAPSSPPNTTPILSRHSLKFYPVQDYRQNPSPEVERTFVEFGAKVRFDRIETGLIIDPDTGEIVNEAKGESNSVTHDIEDLDQAKRYIQFHNHPSLANEVNKPLTMERIEKGDYPVGFLGHGFSPNDVLVAIRDNLLSTRLTTLAYDYHLDLPEVAAIPSSLGKHFSQKRYSFKNEKERMLFYSEMKKFLKLQKQLTMDRLNANKDPAYKRMIFARRKDTPDRISFVCDFPHEMLYPIFKQLGWNYRKMRNHTPDEEVKRQLFIQFGAEAKQDSLPTTSSIDIDTIDPLDRNFLVVDDRDLVVSIELAPEEISELD